MWPHDGQGRIIGGDDDRPIYVASMAWEHLLVHQGLMFHAGHYVASLANGAALDLRIETGATSVHMVSRATCGGDALHILGEDATTTANGTLVPAYQMRRSGSQGTSPLTIHHTPTVTGVGTALFTELVPGGSGGQTPGGSARLGTEWVLKPASIYLLRLTNLAGLAQPVSIALEFYTEG